LSHRWEPLLGSGATLLTKTGVLGLLILIAMAVYFIVAFLIGGVDLGMVRRNLKRKRAKPISDAEVVNGD
jgi:putative peptidoglycan lipid II flippase